jgi:hypothetical protein
LDPTHKIGEAVVGLLKENKFPKPELMVLAILYQGACQSSSSLTVNRRGAAQAGTGVVYLLFPVLFFCFVLHHTLFVTRKRARWLDPARDEKKLKRAEHRAEKKEQRAEKKEQRLQARQQARQQREQQGEQQEWQHCMQEGIIDGEGGQYDAGDAGDARSVVAITALQDINICTGGMLPEGVAEDGNEDRSSSTLDDNEDLLDLRCTGRRLIVEKGHHSLPIQKGHNSLPIQKAEAIPAPAVHPALKVKGGKKKVQKKVQPVLDYLLH